MAAVKYKSKILLVGRFLVGARLRSVAEHFFFFHFFFLDDDEEAS